MIKSKYKKGTKANMYLLDYLKDPEFKKSPENFVIVEYRLLCSGELYNEKVLTFDWRKEDATRLLLTEPFGLTVVSSPFNDYPQELALRFRVREVTETKGRSSYMFIPDEEIARDLAALLSLLCRRLITVAAKVRQSQPKGLNDYPAVFRDWPVPFTGSLKLTSWQRQLSTVVYGVEGVKEIIDYNPPHNPVDPDYLKKMFLALPNLNHAESIVLSARRYALALELIQNRPELSYQFLISSIETIANSVCSSFKPNEDEMVKLRRPVFKLALKFGLSEPEAKQLAIEACKRDSWIYRKFSKFLCENVGDELWTKKDDVFVEMEFLVPKKERFEYALRQIYNNRGKNLHAGKNYPISGTVGASPLIPAKMMLELDTKDPFPPVTWFERVVNIALCTYLRCSAGLPLENNKKTKKANET